MPSANLTSWSLAVRVSTTAFCIAIRALPSIIWRRNLSSCSQLKLKFSNSLSNNLVVMLGWWVVLYLKLLHKSRHVEVANKLGRTVHGEPSGRPKS